ncbi:2-oxo-4-hydroxy-4-carboxy-5-ureidoimidazoline decarboxylase [Streptomyces clavuligerus]|uniref:Putative OHCU decarboxylase n=2 Tax=Streptomyces clavuligerus TaxID=1901 RepID=E2PWY8_STRCL|nr:2-oxo-4-hydroxy-4-carboxy-5-ureidoimidazoline decarboxylase [Streptomyces clavuligerus]AXU11993.1 2-oxo-4-hydroxy-4-carboxy-5-ureidoimidazoline decarboxylase [Streptomyces clavuligerus]EFG10065.1 putative OHCU decarboxylase [Streptomyces clavuligerus]MBY6301843.1 2-oxo-4-hydroxy-4-carboxy-5-ureidoimidazoline decarboxylase [Streptomyces clavuligerus]QCS04773.1 OHCU decarboxylase [Streptomyces clavuligerus]QPJ95852.1 2-oxo-4-hydroxy-4-carboxy-5-ureidoimidazoline decarboxylase [Streptomyces cl
MTGPPRPPAPPDGPAPGLARLNAASDADALAALGEICASRAWARLLLARRPYPDTEALLAAADAALAELTPDDLAEALAGHAPIGAPRPGDPVSAREQHGMTGADAALRDEMRTLNEEYRRRFGQVFLIRAIGLTGEEMRDALRARLGHPPEREREAVRAELGGINRARLTRLARPPTASVSTHVLDTSAGRPAPGVPVTLSVRRGDDGPWTPLGTSATDADGRCRDLPHPPGDTTQIRLDFRTADHLAARAGEAALGAARAFFPEVSVVCAVEPGEHYHVPLLLNPFGYCVYRGS